MSFDEYSLPTEYEDILRMFNPPGNTLSKRCAWKLLESSNSCCFILLSVKRHATETQVSAQKQLDHIRKNYKQNTYTWHILC